MGQSLTVDIGAKTTSFEEGFRRAADIANQNAKAIGRSIDSIGGQLTSITDKFAKFTGALAGIAGVASFTGLIKNSIDAADQIDKLSQKTGIAHETLAGLSYSAKISGTDLDGVAASSARLAKNMAAAATGSAQQQAAFNAVGVAVKNADGSLKSTDKVLGELANKFKGYADGPAKAALAQELFGKSGASMIPLLNQGSEALARQSEEAQKYSGVTKEISQQASAFNGELAKIQLIASGAGTSLAATLLPAMQGISKAFEWLRDHGEEVNAVLIGVGTAATIFAAGSSMASGAVDKLTGAFMRLTVAMLANPFGLIATAIAAAMAALYYFRDTTIQIGNTTTSISDIVVGAWEYIKKGFAAAWEWIHDALEGSGGWFGDLVKGWVDWCSWFLGKIKTFINFIISGFNALGTSIGIIAGYIMERFSGAFDRVRNLAGALWDGIKKIFDGDMSFSAFTDLLKQDANQALDMATQVKGAFTDAFSKDYVGDFGKSVQEGMTGVVESLARAGQEARNTKQALDEITGGGDAPLVGKAFATAVENIDKYIAREIAGYNALYDSIKNYIANAQDALKYQRDMDFIGEKEFIEKRTAMQVADCEAQIQRAADTVAAIKAEYDKLNAIKTAKGSEEEAKQKAKLADLDAKLIKAQQDLAKGVGNRNSAQEKGTQALNLYNKALDDQIKKINESAIAYARGIQERIDDLNFETSLIGKSASAQAKLRAEYDLQKGLKKELLEIDKQIEELRKHEAENEGLINAQLEKRNRLIADTEKAVKNVRNALEGQDWAKNFDQISQSLSDAIYRGFENGKSFADNFKDTLVNTFKTMILKPMIEMSVKGGFNALGVFMGDSKDGEKSFFTNLTNGFGSVFKGFQDMFSTFAKSGIGETLGLSENVVRTNDAMEITRSKELTQSGAAFMKTIPILGYIYAGMMVNNALFSQGWNIANMSETTKQKSIASAFAIDPLQGLSAFAAVYSDKLFRAIGFDDKMSSMLSGSAIFTRLFGSQTPKAKQGGVEGNLSIGGFRGSVFQDIEQKGGLFRGNSHWTEWSAISASMQAAIDQTIGQVPRQIKNALGQFGINFVDVFGEDWKQKFHLVLTTDGKWESMEENFNKATTEVYQNLAVKAVEAIKEGWGVYVDDLKDLDPDTFRDQIGKIFNALAVLNDIHGTQAKVFGVSGLIEQDFEKYAYENEKIYETVARLARTFSITNRIADFAKINFAGVGLDSAGNRQALVDQAGGADALTDLFGSYFDTFATEQDKFGLLTSSLRDTFDTIGVSIPRTVDAFRDLIAAQDMSTDAGRELALQLMQVAPAFNDIIGAVDQLSKSMDGQIADLRRTIEMGGLDQNQTYAYMKKEGDDAFRALQEATGIDDINNYFNQAVQALNQTYGMLDDAGKLANKDAFLRQLDELEAVKNERIEALKDIITGPADAIDYAGKAVATALANVAEQLGVAVDISPFFEVSDAAKIVSDALDKVGFNLTEKPMAAPPDIDALAAGAMDNFAATIKDAAPMLELANTRGVEAATAAGETLKDSADDVRSAFGEARLLISDMKEALANIKVAVTATVVSQEVGHAY